MDKHDIIMNALSSKGTLYPLLLLVLLVLSWTSASINAKDIQLFTLETIAMIALAILFIIIHRKFKFSNLSYTLIFLYLELHSLGAHYSYDIPVYSWFSHLPIKYDHVVHLFFGLLIYYPLKELYTRTTKSNKIWQYLIPFLIILAVSCLYELWEWIFTIINHNLGAAYSAFGNDIWDTQKDMFLSFIGGLFALILTYFTDIAKRRS